MGPGTGEIGELPADAPLAARMRPSSLEEYVGQEHLLGPGKLLRRAIEADRLSSMILYAGHSQPYQEPIYGTQRRGGIGR